MTMLLDENKVIPDAIHIVVADDHPLVRGALRQALTGALANATVREAWTFRPSARNWRAANPSISSFWT